MIEIEDLLMQLPEKQGDPSALTPAHLTPAIEPEDLLLQQEPGELPTALERSSSLLSFDPIDLLLPDTLKTPQDARKPEELKAEVDKSIKQLK